MTAISAAPVSGAALPAVTAQVDVVSIQSQVVYGYVGNNAAMPVFRKAGLRSTPLASRRQAASLRRMATRPRATKRKLPWYLRPFKWLMWFVIISVLWVLIYAVVPPPVTVTMLTDGNGITKDWESLSNIDRNMVRAAIAAEDGKFCSHNGFDRDAIEDAIQRNAKGKRLRGGSTISQQTAKNVFLWQGSGWTRYVRKVPEIWFTFLIEKIWGKRRIMEVYLNVVEWAPGVYGAQAASQHWFGKDARSLTRAEAARLAAILPSPRRYQAADPGPYVRRRAGRIQAAMGTVRDQGLDACVLGRNA